MHSIRGVIFTVTEFGINERGLAEISRWDRKTKCRNMSGRVTQWFHSSYSDSGSVTIPGIFRAWFTATERVEELYDGITENHNSRYRRGFVYFLRYRAKTCRWMRSIVVLDTIKGWRPSRSPSSTKFWNTLFSLGVTVVLYQSEVFRKGRGTLEIPSTLRETFVPFEYLW